MSLVFFPDYYWGRRAATYFRRSYYAPMFYNRLAWAYSLCRRTSISRVFYFRLKLLTNCLYISRLSLIEKCVRSIACLLSSMLCILFAILFKTQIIGLVGLTIGLTFYFLVGVVYHRVNESVSGVLAFLFKMISWCSTDTSSGQRLVWGL